MPQDNALQTGDEPLWYKKMFPNAHIAVGEDRVVAIPRMLQESPEIGMILLDNAYQHRRIEPGLSILITDYHSPFCDDAVVPLGWLRERKENYHRADIIIVSKCPPDLAKADFRCPESPNSSISLSACLRLYTAIWSADEYDPGRRST